MVISKGFGAYNAPKGVVKDIGKAGMPLWGPRFTLRDHASKSGGISGGIHSLGGIPALPRCGGLWWHNATPQSFLSLSSAKLLGALTPKLVLPSFIVLCYTECSFSVPLPLDLILENKINCHLS